MARKRPLESGWCQNSLHSKCNHLMQEANEHRPEILCACRCHPKSNPVVSLA